MSLVPLNTPKPPSLVTIEARWLDANGNVRHSDFGNGTIIGSNDVLTAGHLMFNAAYGGRPTSFTISTAWGEQITNVSSAVARQAYPDGGDGRMDPVDAQNDFGVIGLASNLNIPAGSFIPTLARTAVWGGVATIVGDQPDGVYSGTARGGGYTIPAGTYLADLTNPQLQASIQSSRVGNANEGAWRISETFYSGAALRADGAALTMNGQVIGVVSYSEGVNNGYWSAYAPYVPNSPNNVWIADITPQYEWIEARVAENNPAQPAPLPITPVKNIDWSGSEGKVYRLYEAAFNRKPDEAGFNYWMNFAKAGVDIVTIAAGFQNSPEWKNTYWMDNDAFMVQTMYQNILNRPGEPAGVQYYVDRMAEGAG